MIEKTARHLADSKSILIVSHANPDGDAVSSLLALGLGLEKLNKKVVLYNESLIPAVYRFLPSVDRISQDLTTEMQFDTVIVLDCGDLERIGDVVQTVLAEQVVINIDHHVTNTGFGDIQFVDPEACATAELIHRLLKHLSVPIDTAIATAIYTGILTDTGSFRFSNTNLSTFAICTEMVEKGVRIIGTPPLKSPSLTGYPDCDHQVNAMAKKLWGTLQTPGKMSERKYGEGCIYWGGELS